MPPRFGKRMLGGPCPRPIHNPGSTLPAARALLRHPFAKWVASIVSAGVSAGADQLSSWEHSFRIGDALPVADPVARFVAVLAMIYNDWRRTSDSMVASVEDTDALGVRLLRFRQVVGY